MIELHSTYSGTLENGKFHGHGTLALADNTLYVGCFREGKYHGEGNLTDGEGNTFEGTFVDGKKHGRGLMRYKFGGFYDGEWKDDLRDGKGMEGYPNGHRMFEGRYEKQLRHGEGRLETPTLELSGCWHDGQMVDGDGWKIVFLKSKMCYHGEMKAGFMHGNGTLTSDKNGQTIYAGNFVFGLPRLGEGCMSLPQATHPISCQGQESCEDHQGSCRSKTAPEMAQSSDSECSREEAALNPIYTYANGDTYEGIIDEDNQRQGHGVYRGAGTVYKGEWKDSQRCGKGTLVCKQTGIQYVGRFRNDKMNGLGTLTFMDGSTYKGDFVDGIMNGYGTLTDLVNDSVYLGDFVDGLKHGQGEERFVNGCVFSGEYREGRRCGAGQLFQRRATERELLYRGEWKNDVMEGEGETRQRFGDRVGSYQGEFHRDMCHGRGALTLDDKHIFEGSWEHGVLLDGEWVISLPSGSVFYGTATCGGEGNGLPVPNGFGSQREPNGDFYTGTFLHGRKHGSGLCMFEGGESWDGRWEDGIFAKYGRSSPHETTGVRRKL